MNRAARRHLIQTLTAARKRTLGLNIPGKDDTAALQRSIDLGRGTPRKPRRPFPEGLYTVLAPLRFPVNGHWVVGPTQWLFPKDIPAIFMIGDKAIRFAGGGA